MIGAIRALLKLAARRILFPATEYVYAAVFAAAGTVLRPRLCPQTLIPTGRGRVLVIAPHPDDETLGCGGAIALHSMAGDRVCVAIVTDGGGSRAGSLSRDAMRARRRVEAQRAVARLGEEVELVQMGLPEGRWQPEALQAHVTSLLESYRPTIVYTTSCVDFHPEHIRVAQAVASALNDTDGAAKSVEWVRVYEVQAPLTPILANMIAEISECASAKTDALREYATQARSLTWVARHARYLKALYRSKGNVEVFWQLTPTHFIQSLEICRTTRPHFRGIRLRPFTDGAAWLAGARIRLRLKHSTTNL